MSFFSYAWDWINQSANWQGPGSIPQQILAHLGYSILPLLIATLIGIPAGVAIGHTRRGAVCSRSTWPTPGAPSPRSGC